MNFLDSTIKELHDGLVNKKFSSVELTNFYLDRIEQYDEKIHAYLTVDEEQARATAKKIDSGPPQPPLGKGGIRGVPAGIKDVIVTKGVRSTGASKILDNYIPPYNATVINKLDKTGYVLLGKQNCDEFAQGSSTENSGYGPTRNPWDVSRVPGGTSGGSAAAVAAGLAHYSLGTDTGGSVRQPASYCGVVGLKPTYGRVSRYGLMAMTSSFDQCGVLARRVDDAIEVLRVIEGEDPLDATSAAPPSGSPLAKGGLRGVKIGVPSEYFTEGLDKEVESNIKDSIEQLEKLGAEIKEISLPNFESALATYYIIMFAEVSSNMARYDGVRYGVSQIRNPKSEIRNIEELYKANRSLLGEEVKRRIMLGTYVLSAGYYDAYYGKAQQVRQLIVQDFRKAFENVDVIAGPVAPTPAFKIGQHTDDPLAMYLEDIYTVPVNLAGLPAISIPAGFVKTDNSDPSRSPLGKGRRGLPVGLHLIGKWWEDYKLLNIAETFEQATGHYKVKPEL